MAGPVLSIAGAILTVTGSPEFGIPLQLAGAYITYASQPDTQGPRLQDRTLQISSYGAAIPIVYGAERLAGNVIWPKEFKVDERSTSQSAKGGPSNVSFTYTATFALLVCAGPEDGTGIAGFGRIVMNKKLVYDPNAEVTTDPCISGMRFYLGTEDQDPDPLMVARDGSAPAYRGWAYIVFEELELTNSGFGNRPPSIEVEVFTRASKAGPPEPRVIYLGVDETIPSFYSGIATVAKDTKWVWTVRPETLVDTLHVTVVSDVGEQVITTATAFNPDTVFSPVAVCSLTGHEVWVLVKAWPFPDRHALIARFTKGVANVDGTPAVLPGFIDWFRVPGSIDATNMVYDDVRGQVWIAYNFTNVTEATLDLVDPLTRTVFTTLPTGIVIGSVTSMCVGRASFTTTTAIEYASYVAVLGSSGPDIDPNLLIIDGGTITVRHVLRVPSHHTSGQAMSYDPVRQVFVVVGESFDYHLIDPITGTITTHTLSLPTDHDTVPPPSTNTVAVTYHALTSKFIFGATSGGTSVGTTLYSVNARTLVTENAWTYESGANDLLMNPLLDPATIGNYVLSFDETHVKRLYLGSSITGGPVTLASIVQDICTRDPYGLDVSDIDVTDLETDLVDGYLIGQQMTRRAAIAPLQSAWFFDCVESDHVLKFVKRGKPAVIQIPQDERAAHPDGAEVPPHITITRASELELPWMLDVNYTDKDSDYQVGTQYERRTTRNSNAPVKIDLAIVMTGAKAKQVAIVNLYMPWLRTKFGFATNLAYAHYEPTDVVTLPTDDVTYTARLTSKSDQGNGMIQWEADLEDAAIYTQPGIVSARVYTPQVIADLGMTILELLDIPILRDVDDGPGYYVAMGGTTAGWPGATLYKSADGGSTYESMLSIVNAATIAVSQSVLGDFTAGNIFDEGNSVTVHVISGGPLLSATDTQVLNGINTAVIGAPGRWEVINFKNATLIATDTYQLSGLLRGRRGTEWATGTHLSGDALILASTSTWQRPPGSTGEIGLPRRYKAPPFRTSLTAAPAQSFTDTAVGLKPYSPVDLTGTRDGSNNLTMAWHRRSRIGYGTLNATVPVGEATEAYAVDIYSDGTYTTLLTEILTSAQVASYSAADQIIDFGSPQSVVYCRVYQLSAAVGKGYPLQMAV